MRKRSIAKFIDDCSEAELPNGEVIRFTPTERRIIMFFKNNMRRIITRQALLEALHDREEIKNGRSIDFMINRLRRKLKDDPKVPKYIATHYGKGYEWLSGK